MWRIIDYLFSPDFMPHGYCYLWKPGLLWLNVGSDAIIFFSYSCIPFAILYLYRRRPDLVPSSVAQLFMIFILACGLTHLSAIWNVWHGAYWLGGFIKFVTAIASIITAIMMWILMPKFLLTPTLSTLAKEVEAKNHLLGALKQEQLNLENRVKDRTIVLEAKNKELLDEKQRLEAIQSVTIDRELKMSELKSEINDLLKELNRPKKYEVEI